MRHSGIGRPLYCMVKGADTLLRPQINCSVKSFVCADCCQGVFSRIKLWLVDEVAIFR